MRCLRNCLINSWASYYGGDVRNANGDHQLDSGVGATLGEPRAALTEQLKKGERRELLLEQRLAEAQIDLVRAQLAEVEAQLPAANDTASAASYNCLCTPTDPRCQPTGTVMRLELPPWNGDGGSVGVPPLDWSIEPLRTGSCPSIDGVKALPSTCSSISECVAVAKWLLAAAQIPSCLVFFRGSVLNDGGSHW
eukprot:COSAG02_NODE_491_length_21224_cov_5.973680_10_plen_194_part_00